MSRAVAYTSTKK